MPVTVSMIETREFKNKVRGYDPVEVDEFLDEICDEMVRLQDEISSLQQRLAQTARRESYAPVTPAPAPAPVRSATAESSEAIQKMLANTQRVCDETLAQAKLQAADIVAAAKVQVPNTEIASLTETRDALQSEIDILKTAAKSYRERFLKLIDEQRQMIADEQDLF